MYKTSPEKLTYATMMFPLALVLFEFSVYIGNDLVQPAMLAITQEFGVSHAWAPSSMSFYLLGGACVAAIVGPLSDRLGRKKVLLAGVGFFVISCLAILLTPNIESFLVLRFLQGFGLSVISAVGYAAIQEHFAERDAIRVMAIMANVSLLAPLLGPVLGAFMIEHISWHWGFIGIASLAFLSWFGLKAKMPDTQQLVQQPLSQIIADYKAIFKNKNFLIFTFALPLISMPLMLWIALSPIILIENLALTSFDYGLAQFPVLGGLIMGNLVLLKILDRFPLGQSVMYGIPLMLVGATVMVIGLLIPSHFTLCLIVGMTLISFGEGISFSVLFRFALMSSEVSKGTVAAAVSLLMMLSFFSIIEAVRLLYIAFDLWAYVLACWGLIALWFTLPRSRLKALMKTRHERGEF